MKKVPICGFLCCGEEQISEEEAKQEDFSSIYSQRIAVKTHKTGEMSRSHMQQQREIFSFKLNCFRTANQSDKLHAANSPKAVEACNKLYSFGSCQKYELRAAQSPPQHSIPLLYFCSPQPKVAFKSRECMSPQPKIVIAFTGKQKISKASQVYQSQIERNSRKSERTLDSWKKSQTRFIQTAFQQRQINIGQKCSTKNSLVFDQKGGETERTLIDCLNDEQLPPTLLRMHHHAVVGNLPGTALRMN